MDEQEIKSKIKKVFTGTNDYFVYSMKADMFGKRKKIYGKSVNEVLEKIANIEKKQDSKVLAADLGEEKFSDYARYYFKGIIKSNNTGEVSRQLHICERVVFGTELDKNISEITKQDIQDFYDRLSQKYAYESILDIDKIFRKVFELAAIRNKNHIDFSDMEIKKLKLSRSNANYIFSPEEYEEVLSFCIEDNCKRFGKNEQIVIFCLLTGLKFDVVRMITVNDIDLEQGTVTYKVGRSYPRKITIPLSQKCLNWLTSQAKEGLLLLPISGKNEGAGISRYTCPENTPLFTNSNGVFPTPQSFMSTITHLAVWLGFPKNVSSKSLHKSYVVYELNNGADPNELYKRLGVSGRGMIINIQKEYELQQSLK